VSEPPKYCAVVPTYNNPITVRSVVEAIRGHGLQVILMDDGSSPDGRLVCEQLQSEGLALLHRLPENRGKGTATMQGIRAARDLGYSHAFQIDADSQHDLTRVPAFVSASRAQPSAAVFAYPEYDRAAPRARVWGRLFTAFWITLEVGGRKKIMDALIGFRIYPVQATLEANPTCARMGFDPEVAVLLVRLGTDIVNLPVGVTYLTKEQGGVSHFRMFRDNLSFSVLHARLCTLGLFGWLARPFLRLTKGSAR
jgi:glycosyltransferase involved in cell wall biosynthesis